jgi:hypothetical protein
MWAAGLQKVAKIEEDSEYFCTLPLWRVSQIWLNITKLQKKIEEKKCGVEFISKSARFDQFRHSEETIECISSLGNSRTTGS